MTKDDANLLKGSFRGFSASINYDFDRVNGWFVRVESKSEIWTIERLSDYLKVDIKLLYPIYFSNTKKQDLDHVLKISAKNRKKLVEKVIQKYKIK